MLRPRWAALVLAAAVVSGCSAEPASPKAVSLSLWSHGGTDGEQAALAQEIASFEKAHPGVTVHVTVTPEGSYNDTVQTANAGNRLPDVLDVDGPLVASYAYQGILQSLDPLVDKGRRQKMLPSLADQGTWDGHLWTMGAFDSGLALYGNRSLLAAAGIRIPIGPSDAWTAAELTAGLEALAKKDADGKVIDLKLDYGTGEWLTYGFSPLLSSAGTALVDPATGRAAGTLNGLRAVQALSLLQTWSRRADPDKDGKAFTARRVALSWVGHWTYADYAKALGDDLVLLPLPDLGNGTKSGQGSWSWGVGSATSHSTVAAQLVSWLTDDAAATLTTKANGAIPGTRTSLAASTLVGPGKPLHLYADQLALTCGSAAASRSCVTVAPSGDACLSDRDRCLLRSGGLRDRGRGTREGADPSGSGDRRRPRRQPRLHPAVLRHTPQVRLLHPVSRDLGPTDLIDLYDEPGPFLPRRFVASADGVIAVDGRSEGLSSTADKAVFRALRTVCDAVVVGAGTAREENYGPVKHSEEAAAWRAAHGRSLGRPWSS